LRTLGEKNDIRGYESMVSAHTRRMQRHLARNGAFLFLLGSQPRLMSGLPAERLGEFDRVKWRHLGPFIQRLVRGATQWTLAPAPSSDWADAAYADLPEAARLPALWRTVIEALWVTPAVGAALRRDSESPSRAKPAPTPAPIAAWHTHLASLARRRDELNAARHRTIRYAGPGTDLTLALPHSHVWCTAQHTTKTGFPFVANLPTEEIFTAPHRNSATGTVRIARPVTHGGAVIENIELEFRGGRVVQARASAGQDILQHLLATDEGAGRIGEVAMLGNVGGSLAPDVPGPVTDRPYRWQTAGRLFQHTLLDENAAPHIALGDAYRFCSRAWLPLALNSSQVHLDLPLDAKVEFL
jgi:aminopeptidase